MSYNSVADMAESFSLTRREVAAAAKESVESPEVWVQAWKWKLASSPGWDAAWDSAVAGGVAEPGADEAVITDAMILSAVQAISEPE